MNEQVQVACLPRKYSLSFPKPGTPLTFAGWGRNECNSSLDSERELKNMKLNVYDPSKQESRCTIKDFQTQLCAGNLNGMLMLIFSFCIVSKITVLVYTLLTILQCRAFTKVSCFVVVIGNTNQSGKSLTVELVLRRRLGIGALHEHQRQTNGRRCRLVYVNIEIKIYFLFASHHIYLQEYDEIFFFFCPLKHLEPLTKRPLIQSIIRGKRCCVSLIHI